MLSNKVTKLFLVVAGIMLVGVAAASPIRDWVDDVSPHPLDGWETLKFGMTPRQVCSAMNKAGIKCTIECLGEKSISGKCTPPNGFEYTRGVGEDHQPQVSIGATRWDVIPLYFDEVHGISAEKNIDVGQLAQILLRSSIACDTDAVIHTLEQEYGTFSRDPANSRTVGKKFANGAIIIFAPWGKGCAISYRK